MISDNPIFGGTGLSTEERSRLLGRSDKPFSPENLEKRPCLVLVPENWQQQITADVAAATSSITMSALSLLPPRAKQVGPWPELWNALCAAAARQVHITIYLPAPGRATAATSQNATAAKIAHDQGMTVHLIPGPRLLHAKQMILDDSIIWIGSANWTAAAFAFNFERWCRVEATHLALKMRSHLNAIRYSHRTT